MENMHRNSVYGDADTVQYSLLLDSLENHSIIENAHIEEMNRINNQHEIDKLNTLSNIKINESNARANNESILLNAKAESEAKIMKAKGEVQAKMKDLDYQHEINKLNTLSNIRINESNARANNESILLNAKAESEAKIMKAKGEVQAKMKDLEIKSDDTRYKHEQEMKKLADKHVIDLEKIKMQSKAQDQAHEKAMDEQEKQHILNVKEADRIKNLDELNFKKEMENINIKREDMLKKHEETMTNIHQAHEISKIKAEGELEKNKQEVSLKLEEMKNKFKENESIRNHDLEILKEKGKDRDQNFELKKLEAEQKKEEIEKNYEKEKEKMKAEHEQKIQEEKNKNDQKMEELKGQNEKDLKNIEMDMTILSKCQSIDDIIKLKQCGVIKNSLPAQPMQQMTPQYQPYMPNQFPGYPPMNNFPPQNLNANPQYCTPGFNPINNGYNPYNPQYYYNTQFNNPMNQAYMFPNQLQPQQQFAPQHNLNNSSAPSPNNQINPDYNNNMQNQPFCPQAYSQNIYNNFPQTGQPLNNSQNLNQTLCNNQMGNSQFPMNQNQIMKPQNPENALSNSSQIPTSVV